MWNFVLCGVEELSNMKNKYINVSIAIIYYIIAQLIIAILERIIIRLNLSILAVILANTVSLILIIVFFGCSAFFKVDAVEVGQFKKPIKPLSLLILPLIVLFCIITFLPIQSWIVKIMSAISKAVGGHSIEGPQIYSGSVGYFFLSVLCIAIIPAFGEEILFRGAVFSGFKTMGVKKAILLSALLFSLFHMNILQTVYQFIFGIILAIILLMSGSIFATIITHFLNNLIVIIYGSFLQDKINLNKIGNWIYATDFAAILIGLPILLMLMYAFYYITREGYAERITYLNEGEYDTEKREMPFKVETIKKPFLRGLIEFFGGFFSKQGWKNLDSKLEDLHNVPYIGTKKQPMLSMYIVFALGGASLVAVTILTIAGK